MTDPGRSRPARGGGRLLIIVPAYNEQDAIGETLASLSSPGLAHDVLVVNDGSTDATAAIARRSGAKLLDLACNLSVGGAMQAGYQFAEANGYDTAVQFDADGQHRADQIPALLARLDAGGVDMVIGSRWLADSPYRFSIDRLVGSRLLSALVRLLTGRRITDPTSGFRAANRRAIRFFSRHYPQSWLGDTVEALVQLCRHGMAVAEVAAQMLPRRAGSSAAGTITGFIHTLRIVLAVLIDCIERKFDDVDLKEQP